MRYNSWIIVSKTTGKPVIELFSRKLVDLVNVEKYEVFTSLEWLQKFNREVSQQNS